jgi:wyosine [tRNA(Phe)-imidazoG37] synthetase (radical SAM superfamily)
MNPRAVYADQSGKIFDIPGLPAPARTGNTILLPEPDAWMEAPCGTDYYLLPHRAYGYHHLPQKDMAKEMVTPVAAFLPPGYVRLFLPAAFPLNKGGSGKVLPQFAYCAAGWHKNVFYVTAQKVDYDPFWDPAKRNLRAVTKAVGARSPSGNKNRLLQHLSKCALGYNCYTAQNIFLCQGEGGIPVSPACNARCAGCISFGTSTECTSSHQRISFTPSVDEIADLAIPHLRKAQQAIISFGQGCEGEPTLQKKTLCAAIKEIRKATSRGTIHINTNGSQTKTIKELAETGLDSIRISMNSAQKKHYERYYRPAGYRFEDVAASLTAAKKLGLFVSINLLVFPGVSDRQSEVTAIAKLIGKAKPDLVQLRNLNIDPDLYMKIAGGTDEKCIGFKKLIEVIKDTGTQVGYFNRPI